MNTINTNMRIVLKLIVISQLVLLVLCIPVSGQNVKADFAIKNDSPCGKFAEFGNESENATNFLWEISRSGYETIITPTRNPVVSFDQITMPAEVTVKLTAFNVDNGKTHDTTKTIIIHPAPSVQMTGEWQTMVCSNKGEMDYCLEYKEGYEYSWNLTGEDDYFELSNDASNCATITWKRNTGIQPSEMVLICEVTSDFGCVKKITKKFLLLPDAVPESASIRRKDDTNILLCLFDRPVVGNEQISGNYLYQWGFYPLSDPENVTIFPLTENAYHQFETINEELNTYFVDVFNTDYSFCKTRIEGITGQTTTMKSLNNAADISVLKLYPNPVQSQSDLHIELIRNNPNITEVNFAITGFSGAVIKTIPFTLSTEINHLIIPIGELNNGFYLLEAIIKGDQRVVKKFVVLNN
jgi:hypothetical protein